MATLFADQMGGPVELSLRRLDGVMYRHRMKKSAPYLAASPPPAVLQDRPNPLADDAALGRSRMVRTQIYLTRSEHEFVSAEAARQGGPMAAIIRSYIDEKMRLPDAAWRNNPMLEATPKDPGFVLPEDAAINHDHYLYGAAKKYLKKRGKWVPVKAVPSSPG